MKILVARLSDICHHTRMSKTERITFRVTKEEKTAIENFCDEKDENINRIARKGIRLVIPAIYFKKAKVAKGAV